MREFLEARLLQVEGKALVVATHQRLAVAARDIDWRISAYHYREAGDTESMLASVGEAIPTIMGDGQYDLAESFIASVGNGSRPTKFDLIISRVDMQQGDYEAAIATSRAVLESESLDRVNATMPCLISSPCTSTMGMENEPSSTPNDCGNRQMRIFR